VATQAQSAETAASFGYSLAFFNSNPELKKLLGQATAGGWSSARFVASLQNTHWFRASSESARKYTALKSSDPATYKQQISAGAARVMALGNDMGSIVTGSQARSIADTALKVGWTDDQLKLYLASKAKVDSKGYFTYGEAAKLQNTFRSMVADYGLTVPDKTIQGWVRQGLTGARDTENIRQGLVRMATSKYVGLADRIKSGETVREIAAPYIQSYGKLLEVNPENIDIDDPLLQRALQAKDAKGKPATQTVYDFEQTLRKDPRWRKTNNARDLMASTANAVLDSFGLA
jgi:hypothetical protein